MASFSDYCGFGLSTNNGDAALSYDKGARSFVAWRADAIGHLDVSIAEDPDFPLPKILKAWILQGGRSARFGPKIDELMADAQRTLGDASQRERVLSKGLERAREGNLQAGAAIIEAYLADEPMDLVAHRLLQFELFWSGESNWMRDVVERARPAWNEGSPDFAHFLAVQAFSNEEAGDYCIAEKAGRAAVALEPESAWGAHAVAHALLMKGQIEEGVVWLESLCGNWGQANQIKHHNWWHLCLFLLEKNEHEYILHLLDTEVRNPDSPLVQAVPDATIDLQNVAALLKRLELRSVDVGERWHNISDICAGRIHDHVSPFTSAHDAMVLAAIGKFNLIDELCKSMHAHGMEVTSAVSNVTRTLGIPLVQAMAAHRKEEHDTVVDLLWPIRRALFQVGGSHAQRDIFFQVMVHSAMQAGRQAQLSVLLDDIAGIGFDKVDQRSLYKDASTKVA